jgi:hypothetical protein
MNQPHASLGLVAHPWRSGGDIPHHPRTKYKGYEEHDFSPKLPFRFIHFISPKMITTTLFYLKLSGLYTKKKRMSRKKSSLKT